MHHLCLSSDTHPRAILQSAGGREIEIIELELFEGHFHVRAARSPAVGEQVRVVLPNDCYFAGEIVRSSEGACEGRFLGFH